MGAANKLYNGNIAETFWSTATDGGFVRNYGYKYDNLNRLKDATYQKSGQLTNMYNENLSYDKNGNIMNLSRYGDRDEQYLPIQIDNLGYNYGTNSNQLKSVTDATNNTSGFKDGNTTGDDYVYDANGNMTVDKNKNITGIVYNHLNLPTKIIFPTGNIVYFYNASGQKVQKVVTENTTVTTTDYLGGYQYKNTVLQFFPIAEGYVKNTAISGTNTYSYVFNYTDQLGNVRLSYTKDTTTGSLKILEESNYYPFGLKHSGYNADNFQPGYKYKYQGQERQDELSLNWDSFKWRNYDYAIGRFMSIDPLSEKYAYNSPYAFSENRVIDGRELEGLEWVPVSIEPQKPSELRQKSPSPEAQKQHYLVTIANSEKSFSQFKSDFMDKPQDFLTNSKATFGSPVDGNGNKTDFKKGSYIDINIGGIFTNNYVKVVGMEEKKKSLTTTFGTLDGHIEKGKITFRLIENKDGSITFSIDSLSEVDHPVVKLGEDRARSEQKESWKEVLKKIEDYLGGDTKKKETK